MVYDCQLRNRQVIFFFFLAKNQLNQLTCSLFFHISISQKMALRKIIKSVPATKSGPIIRLIGSVDFKGQGINHPLESVDPVILLDYTGKFSGKGKIRS